SDPATINGVSVCGVVHQEITGTTRKTTSTVTAEGEERKSLQHRHYLGRRQKGTRSQESSVDDSSRAVGHQRGCLFHHKLVAMLSKNFLFNNF
ncbi:hypothetical protein J6590_104824, partial [Homalodisca vitripennis]